MIKTELEAYESLLCSHLDAFVWRLRKLPPEQFDYQFAPAAPSARILATHAWQWLICDRYHIGEPDASLHPRVPDPPTDPAALVDALAEETENWRKLLRSLTPADLDAPRSQFSQPSEWMGCTRDFICHMIQNTIYKNGQFTTIFFALGHDGTEPYDAPFPNPIYEELFGAKPA